MASVTHRRFLLLILASLSTSLLWAQLPPRATGLPGGTSLGGQSMGKIVFSGNSVWWIRPGSPAHRVFTTAPGVSVADAVHAQGRDYVLQNDGQIYQFTWGDPTSATWVSRVILADTTTEVVRRMTRSMEVTSSRRVYSTPDNGVSWNLDTLGIGGASPSDIDQDASGTLYLAAGSAIFRRPVDSTRWTKLTITGGTGSVTALRVDATGMMLAAQGGLWSSTDGGATWKRDTAGFGTASVTRVTIGNVNGQQQFFIVGNGGQRVYTRASAAAPWSRIDQAILSTINDPFSPPTISAVAGDSTLVATTTVGAFISEDGGATWVNQPSGFEPENVGGIVRAGGHDFVATDLGVFRGRLGDTVWTRVWPATGYLRVTGLRSDASGVVYLIGPRVKSGNNTPRVVLESSDGGATWTVDSAGISLLPSQGVYYVDPWGTQHMAVSGGARSTASLWVKTAGNPWVRDTAGLGTIATGEAVTAIGSDGGAKIFAGGFIGGAAMWSRPRAGGQWSIDSSAIDTAIIYSMTGTSPLAAGGVLNHIFERQGNGWATVRGPAGLDSNDVYLLSRDSSGALFGAFRMPRSNGFFTSYTYSGIFFTSDAGNRWLPCGASGITAAGLASFGDTTYLTISGRGAFLLTSRSIARLALDATTLSFGNANVGETKALALRISNTGTDTLLITSITSDNAVFASTLTAVAVPPASFVVDTVRFAPSGSGFAGGSLAIVSNAPSSPDHVTLEGNGLASSFMISQRSVDFGRVRVGVSAAVRVVFTNRGSDTLHITAIEGTNPLFEAAEKDIRIAGGGSVYDSLVFTPRANGIESGLLIVRSNAASSPDTIRVTGEGMAPVLSVSPISFGTVAVGSTRSRAITVQNRGTDTLHVAAVHVAPAVFSTSLGAFALAPGGTMTDSVRFAPDSSQVYSGTLVLVSNALSSPDTVTMTGAGTVTGVREAIPTGWTVGEIAPNPARNRASIAIAIPGADWCDVRLTDMLGRDIAPAQRVELFSGSAVVVLPDLARIPAGSYFVRVSTPLARALRQFVKTN